MRISVSGLPGSGTTTLARCIAGETGLPLISAGEVFRRMADEQGMDLAKFGDLARTDPTIDRMIDERQKEIAYQQEGIIVEGRLSGWMVPDATLKVWLKAPLSCRVQRISMRDSVDAFETAMALTTERESCEAARYMDYYCIDISDLSPYDLVLDSSRWGPDALVAIVSTAIGCIDHD